MKVKAMEQEHHGPVKMSAPEMQKYPPPDLPDQFLEEPAASVDTSLCACVTYLFLVHKYLAFMRLSGRIMPAWLMT
jgi:hypothetical protein